ncbi:MAG: SdiA-regulated domain-containing protein [Flavisolibacter sp.]
MLFQRKCLPACSLVFVCAMALLASCKHKSFTSPHGYDLNNPQQMELGKVLNEISGVVFHDDNDDLLGISDSRRQVFEINPKSLKLKDYTDKLVPPDSDLEDLARANGRLFLLASNGTIFDAPESARDTAGVTSYQINLPEPNDFETLYYDPSADGLIMLCKSCAFDKGEKRQSAFRFNLETKTFDTTVYYSISKEDVKEVLKDDDAKFDPSAAAIHPENKRLYIISSAGNLLVVADTRGKVVEAYKLNPDLYPQPEGIAFAPNGTMFITNEGKYGKPTLYIFPYQKDVKKK